MLQVENRILRLIACGASLEDITNQVCRDVEASLPSLFCAIWRTDATGTSQLLAAPSLSRQLTIEGALVAPDVDPAGTTTNLEIPVFIPVIKDAHCEALTAFGAHARWASSIAGEDGRTIGVLALYSAEPRTLSPEEIVCITSLRELCEIAFRRHQRDEHTRQADTDALTGLPNRAAFDRALAGLGADRPGAWALLVLDLDNLKTVNDIFGHKAGDDLIRIAGTRIAQTMAPDVTFRLGGDEFVVIIVQAESLRDLNGAARRIFTVLDEPAICDGQAVVPTARSVARFSTAPTRERRAFIRTRILHSTMRRKPAEVASSAIGRASAVG